MLVMKTLRKLNLFRSLFLLAASCVLFAWCLRTQTQPGLIQTVTAARAAATVSLAKSASVNQVTPGGSITYTLTVSNTGTEIASFLNLSDTLPTATTFVSVSAPSGWNCTNPGTGNTGAVNCLAQTMAAQTSAIITIVVNVATTVAANSALVNSAVLTGENFASTSASATVNVVPVGTTSADLVVSNSGPVTAVAGTIADYSVSFVNLGPSTARTLTITATLPTGTTLTSFTPGNGMTCSTPALNAGGNISCTMISLASGTGESFVFSVRLAPNITCDRPLISTATITAATVDPNTTNNISTVQTTALTLADLSVTASGAPASAVPDTTVVYSFVVSNRGPSDSPNTQFNDLLPASFTAEAITASQGSCTGVGSGTVNCALGLLPAGQSVKITIQTHVPETCQPATAVNTASVASSACLSDPVAANNSATTTINVLLANLGPGACVPAQSSISSSKPGSVMFAGLFSSAATGDTNQNNTRVNLTNVHPTLNVVVHLFFVDGATCAVADSFLCLTANQTTSFFMSDVDPGTTGYMMALAVDGPAGFAGGHNTGCPISFNYLIGNANIKFTASPRRDIDLETESVASEFGSPVPTCNPNDPFAELYFDGSPRGFNQLPRVLALDNIPSRAEGNDTFLMLARVDGNWATGIRPIGTVFGLLYDDAENVFSFNLNVGTCLLRSSLNNNFPRTTPRFENIIPAGRSGWMKLWTASEAAIVGAMHNRNDNSTSTSGAFEGGHNLHVLRLLPSAVITVPVFPPSC